MENASSKKGITVGRGAQHGAALLYFIGVLVVLSTLAAAMLTMFQGAADIATTKNHEKLALYMAESGLRYAISQLKQEGGGIDSIIQINSIPKYTVENDLYFEVSAGVLGSFESVTGVKVTGGSIFEVKQPGDVPFMPDFTIPVPPNNKDKFKLIASDSIPADPKANNDTIVDGITFNDDRTRGYISCQQELQPKIAGRRFFLAIPVTSSAALDGPGGNIGVGTGASDDVIFPRRNGVVTVVGQKLNQPDKNAPWKMELRYAKKECDEYICMLYDLTKVKGEAWDTAKDSIDVKVGDLVVLNSEYNMNVRLSSTGYSGGGSVQADYTLDTTTSVVERSYQPKDSITHDDPHNVVTSDPTQTPIEITADPGLNLGAGIYYTFGAAWYSGTKSGIDLECIDGRCLLGRGLRTFFTIKFTQNNADGFFFALMNGMVNDYYDIGGDSRYGELIAYAGDSRVYSDAGDITHWADKDSQWPRDGIRPPKIGFEFDTYNNGNYGCQCSSDASSRTSVRNESGAKHISFMYHGDDVDDTTNDNCCDTCQDFVCLENSGTGGSWTQDGIETYDDNKHGSGENLSYADSFQSTDAASYQDWWNKDSASIYAVRAEVHRDIVPVSDALSPYVGMYEYRMRIWVHSCDSSCSQYIVKPDPNDSSTWYSPEYSFSDLERDLFINFEKDYFPEYPLLLEKTFYLPEAEHDMLDYVLIGFTEATGGATQTAEIRNYKVQFRRSGDGWIWDNDFDPDVRD